MRLSCIYIGCLVLVACCSLARSEVSNGPDRCCFAFASRKLPVSRVESYHTTHLQCNMNGVIFVTKAQKEICADPTERWVQWLMRLVDNSNLIWPKVEIDTKAKRIEAAPFQQPQKITLVHLKESHDRTTQTNPNTEMVKESVATRGTTRSQRADESTLVHLKESHDWTDSDTTKVNPNTQTVKESVATRGTTRSQRADELTLVHLKESHDWTDSDTTKANPNTQTVKEPVATKATRSQRADESTLVHLKESHDDWTDLDTTKANPNIQSAYFCMQTDGE